MAKKPQRDTGTPEKRNPRLLIFMLIGLCILFVISYASRRIENSRVQAEVIAMDSDIAQSQRNQAELEAQLEFVESDAYVDQVARNELGLAKPGDSVIIVLPAIENPSAEQDVEDANSLATAPQASTDLPNWRQWLQLFTQDRSAALQ